MGSVSNLLLLENQAMKKQHGGNMRHPQLMGMLMFLPPLLLEFGFWKHK